MLNLNCVICAELFTQTDEVHVTVCGHMFHILCLSQWLERSKTCPQCRNRCNQRNIFRLYFNLANLDTSRIDISSLQEQLDNSNLQLKIKENELKKAEEQINNLKSSQKKYMKTITGMESELKKKDFVLLSYAEQIKMLKTEAKAADDLRKNIKSLKQQLEVVESVSCVLAASNAETEKLLKTENDPRKLATLVTTLKRELRNCNSKNTDTRNVLRLVQSDLRREIEHKKELEERVSQLESECYLLNEKLKAWEKPTSSGSRYIYTSPTTSLASKVTKEDKRQTLSPSIKETIRQIEESDSPYLNIKSSSVGLIPYSFKHNQEKESNDSNTAHTTTKLAKLKVSPTKSAKINGGSVRKLSSDITEKYSIFKKPRLGLPVLTVVNNTTENIKPLPSNFVFDGFGGSEKIDPFAQNPFDDDLKIVEDTSVISRATKPLGNDKNFKSKTASLIKFDSVTKSNLNDRLKSKGLRNFMTSNRSKQVENNKSDK